MAVVKMIDIPPKILDTPTKKTLDTLDEHMTGPGPFGL